MSWTELHQIGAHPGGTVAAPPLLWLPGSSLTFRVGGDQKPTKHTQKQIQTSALLGTSVSLYSQTSLGRVSAQAPAGQLFASPDHQMEPLGADFWPCRFPLARSQQYRHMWQICRLWAGRLEAEVRWASPLSLIFLGTQTSPVWLSAQCSSRGWRLPQSLLGALAASLASPLHC